MIICISASWVCCSWIVSISAFYLMQFLPLFQSVLSINVPEAESEDSAGLWRRWRQRWTIVSLPPKISHCFTCHQAGEISTASSLTVRKWQKVLVYKRGVCVKKGLRMVTTDTKLNFFVAVLFLRHSANLRDVKFLDFSFWMETEMFITFSLRTSYSFLGWE